MVLDVGTFEGAHRKAKIPIVRRPANIYVRAVPFSRYHCKPKLRKRDKFSGDGIGPKRLFSRSE